MWSIVPLMLEILKQKPDEVVEIADDNSAKIFLLELGIAGRFKAKSEGATATDQGIRFTEHQTHCVLALLYLGRADQAQNGYMIYCLPKSKHTFIEFNVFADEVQRITSERVFLGVQ